MTLYENFNMTNQTMPHAEAHDIFVVYVKSDDCGIVQDLEYEQRCNFVRKTASCRDHVNMIDYITFVYCTVDPRSEIVLWLLMLGLIIFVCYMFSILGSTADMFLCPALTAISTVLHMNENLAGVTLLAFGNGSPDIFTSLANMDGDDTTMLISEAYGAACFVIGAISGVILIIRPFKVYPAPFLRDAIFLLLISFYISYIMFDGTVSFAESVSIIIIYFVYITVVIMDQFILMNMSRDVQQKIDLVATGNAGEELEAELLELRDEGILEVLGIGSQISLNRNDTESALFVGETANSQLLRQFWESLNPINQEEWEAARRFGKFFIILKTPAVLILLLTVPIVDYERKIHGWSKLLNILQLFITPVFLVLVSQSWSMKIFHLSIFVYLVFISIPVMIGVFMTSRTDKPPFYHIIYAFLAMVTCIFVIQAIASEIVTILGTVGIAAKLSPSFLGCTILAWGNSVGDLISNITLAKQGHHKMGFAACFGGPLIIIILGIGISFIYSTVSSPSGIADVRQGSMGPACNLFLILILLACIIGIGLAKFQARRSLGFYLLGLYFLFLVYAVLGEFEIFHPLGTDHRDQRVTMD